MPYTRVLIKISGEQLSGKHGFGIDPEIAVYLAQEIKQAQSEGCQIVLVVGGGNMVRGEKVAGNGIKRVTADQMGMLSGLINALCLSDIFEAQGIDTRCLSNIFASQVCEPYTFKGAEKHLKNGRVLIVSGGIGRPYFTHDTAGVNIALELDCQVMLKATKVDGVYDKDPIKFKDAVKMDTMNYKEALSNEDIMVMDKAAMGLAMEQGLSVIIFNPMESGNIAKVCKGEKIGSIIS
jgi:uridylate kinase